MANQDSLKQIQMSEEEPRLLREDAFPPARDEPARETRAGWEPASPRPPFLEPEPLLHRTIKRVQRATALQRWYKGNGWKGPSVRYARGDADDCYAE